jgi:signal transduction histidine kinase
MLERMADSAAEGAFVGRVRIVKRTISGFVRRATLLLDVARLNDDELRLYPQPVDVGALVDGVVGTYADEARFHGATLRTELEPGLSARWDAQAVDQILSNLVTNAIKYASSDEIVVGAAAAGPDAIRLTVADRGVGIPHDCVARIFERFERVVGRPGRTIGFGLGLWIVGGIVRAHRGTIEVETEPGAGTRFHVLLPRGVSSADPTGTPSP